MLSQWLLRKGKPTRNRCRDCHNALRRKGGTNLRTWFFDDSVLPDWDKEFDFSRLLGDGR